MTRRKATHTHFTPGKRVFVKTQTGEHFVDVFLETKSRSVLLKERGKILNSDIASMTIYRAPMTVTHPDAPDVAEGENNG